MIENRGASVDIRSYNHKGIYAIINKVTDVWYVGMTTASFRNRWMHHIEDLQGGIHHNKDLQRDFRIYGPQAFVFRILEVIEDERLIPIREKYYIAAYAQSHLLFNVKDNPQRGERSEQ